MTDDQKLHLKEMQNRAVVRLVDDDESFLNSLTMLLQMKGWSVKKYSDPAAFLNDEIFKSPGCIVLDMRMPNLTGLQVQTYLNEMSTKSLPIIFLTGHGDVESAVHTLKHGAFDFLQKPVPPLRLLESIEKAVEFSMKQQQSENTISQIKSKFDSLTKREKEVFIAVANALSNKEISEKLNIAVPTVKMHRANAFEKMEIHSSAEAAKLLPQLS